MQTYEKRLFSADLSFRAESDGRTIYGIAVPYDVEMRVSKDTTEVFREGAFSDVVRAPHRVKLLRGHDAKAYPLGRATLLRETDKGLYAEFKISKTREGDEALELIKDGALDQLSIGFMPLKNRKRPDGVIERLKAHLAEVSLVTFGAYGDYAMIAGTRAEDRPTTPRLDAASEILKKLRG